MTVTMIMLMDGAADGYDNGNDDNNKDDNNGTVPRCPGRAALQEGAGMVMDGDDVDEC